MVFSVKYNFSPRVQHVKKISSDITSFEHRIAINPLKMHFCAIDNLLLLW
jgi:hypothetical protein